MVLDCYATWCGPCKVIAPKIVESVVSLFSFLLSPSLLLSFDERLYKNDRQLTIAVSFLPFFENRFSEEFTKAAFYKLDVDDVPEVAQELGIRAMPTFLIFKDGQKVGEVVGANPAALKTAIKGHYGE